MPFPDEAETPEITFQHVIGTLTCDIFALRAQLEAAHRRIAELEAAGEAKARKVGT